jgi:L-rhamnose mutarotase
MGQLDVNGRWQAEMAGFFQDMGDDQPDRSMRALPEIFHID